MKWRNHSKPILKAKSLMEESVRPDAMTHPLKYITMTNLTQKIETSITPDQFIWGIKSEATCLMLMHKTVERITNEFRRVINSETPQSTDYSIAVELISELDEYGFKEEAAFLMTELTNLTLECNIHLAAWLRLQYKHLNMRMPEALSLIPTQSLKGRKIFIEHMCNRNGIIEFSFCYRECMEEEGTSYFDAQVLVQDIIEYATVHMDFKGVDDNDSLEGDRVERAIYIGAQILVEEFTREVIEQYVFAGKEIVIL